MGLGITHFKFEIRPIPYMHPNNSQIKSLDVEVQINGRRYAQTGVLLELEPWESEIDQFFARAAHSLKTLAKTEALKPEAKP